MTRGRIDGVIRWEAPPPSHKWKRGPSRRVWADVADELREHPGEWALIDDACSAPSLASDIKNAKSRIWAPAGAFDTAIRIIDGRNHIYAVYLGDSPRTRLPLPPFAEE